MPQFYECISHDSISPLGKPIPAMFTGRLSACANNNTMAEWNSITLVSKDLDLELTLCSGQAFRWVRVQEDEWSGAIGEK